MWGKMVGKTVALKEISCMNKNGQHAITSAEERRLSEEELGCVVLATHALSLTTMGWRWSPLQTRTSYPLQCIPQSSTALQAETDPLKITLQKSAGAMTDLRLHVMPNHSNGQISDTLVTFGSLHSS